MQRAFGISITLLWLACMAALLQRDVLPFWRAQDPPVQPLPSGRFQVAIWNDAGLRLGTTWLSTNPLHKFGITKVNALTLLRPEGWHALLARSGELYWETDLSYDEKGALSEFTCRLSNQLLSAVVNGVRFEREYACTAEVGGLTRTMALDGRLSQYLGDSFRPFTHLEGLYVGQTWRLRVLDPLALMTSRSLDFTTQLVRVTKRETIDHNGVSVECFRIESDGATAWADDSGRVLAQEVSIPLLGTWRIVDEPFDADAHAQAVVALSALRRQNAGAPDAAAAREAH